MELLSLSTQERKFQTDFNLDKFLLFQPEIQALHAKIVKSIRIKYLSITRSELARNIFYWFISK